MTKLRTMILFGVAVLAAPASAQSYYGSSGAQYQYDLSNPRDQLRYSVDPSAQLHDSINVDPRRNLDRSLGQYGGGAVSPY